MSVAPVMLYDPAKGTHMIKHTALALTLLATSPVQAQDITEASVRAHERFLTSAPLRGRGSASADEAVAAAYVAAQFEAAGLVPSPGMTGFIQTGPVTERLVTGAATLTGDGAALPGALLFRLGESEVEGAVVEMKDSKAPVPAGAVLVYTGPESGVIGAFLAARAGKARLLVVPPFRGGEVVGGTPSPANPRSISKALKGTASSAVTVAILPPAALRQAAAAKRIAFAVPTINRDLATTNAIGHLPGTDPNAKLLLVSAHLDHLGVDAMGVIRQGANDNASGTVAVIELARALAAGPRPKRGILFAAFGAEEAGLLGSKYFGEHPPVPLDRLSANIEFEMIGAQDPKLPKGALMMTGLERSDLGRFLQAHGAKVAGDPYPDQHFFQRSDNYALALKGIVAHTLSGWATVPTYHQPTDTFEAIDLPFMTAAIRSLVAPLRALANDVKDPAWVPGGRPTE